MNRLDDDGGARPSNAESPSHSPLTGMIWGVKESFLTYLAGVPDAETSVMGGAGRTPSNEYYFPLDDRTGFDTVERKGRLRFRGDVRFAGYDRMLFVVVKDPWLDFAGAATAVLSVDDVYGTGAENGRLPLVDIVPGSPVLHNGTLIWTAMRCTLTPAGCALFNDTYAAGEALAPLHVRIPAS